MAASQTTWSRTYRYLRPVLAAALLVLACPESGWSLDGAQAIELCRRILPVRGTPSGTNRQTVCRIPRADRAHHRLHPRMVNASRPVTIVVDGRVRFQGRIVPSLVTMLESYRRRQDWGLIYPMKVVIDLR